MFSTHILASQKSQTGMADHIKCHVGNHKNYHLLDAYLYAKLISSSGQLCIKVIKVISPFVPIRKQWV